MRGNEQGVDVFFCDRNGKDRGKLVHHFSNRRWVAKLVAFDDAGGNSFLVCFKKVESALHAFQQSYDTVRVSVRLAFAGEYHNKGKSRNHVADIKEHRESFLLQFYALNE